MANNNVDLQLFFYVFLRFKFLFLTYVLIILLDRLAVAALRSDSWQYLA